MTLDEAIETVARRALAEAAADLDWCDFPDIGEHDWDKVIAKADAIADRPSADEFDAAYQVLAAQSDDDA